MAMRERERESSCRVEFIFLFLKEKVNLKLLKISSKEIYDENIRKRELKIQKLLYKINLCYYLKRKKKKKTHKQKNKHPKYGILSYGN